MAFPWLFPHGINSIIDMVILEKKYDLLITCCSKHGPDAAEVRDQC